MPNILSRLANSLLFLLLTMLKSMIKGLQDVGTKAVFGSETVTTKESFYQLIDKNMNFEEVPMSKYKDNVLLVVNVASNWGLTKQNYTELSKLVDEFGTDKGFKILAFPCNQFGAQEPGKHEEILNFVDQFDCRDKLNWFKKGHVNGAKTREVFSFLKHKLPASDGTTDVRWNFAKFLVDHEGTPYKRYGPKTSPFDIKPDIEELLKRMKMKE